MTNSRSVAEHETVKGAKRPEKELSSQSDGRVSIPPGQRLHHRVEGQPPSNREGALACPWLIKRFIDADAEFLFVARDHEPLPPVARSTTRHPWSVWSGGCAVSPASMLDPGLEALHGMHANPAPSADADLHPVDPR